MSKNLSPARNKLGTEGANAVFEFLHQRFSVIYVQEAGKPLQDENIDFVVSPPKTDKIYIEAKADQYVHRPSGNFAFEMLRIKHDLPLNRFFYPSWGINSRANYLIVYSTVNRVLYIVDMPKLRTAANLYLRTERNSANVGAVFTDDLRTSINVYVPKKLVEHQTWGRSNAGEWQEVRAA